MPLPIAEKISDVPGERGWAVKVGKWKKGRWALKNKKEGKRHRRYVDLPASKGRQLILALSSSQTATSSSKPLCAPR